MLSEQRDILLVQIRTIEQEINNLTKENEKLNRLGPLFTEEHKLQVGRNIGKIAELRRSLENKNKMLSRIS